MAHKKAGGSTRLGRDSESKRLGVKVFGGQTVTAGSIIVRQKGTRFGAGANAAVSRDHSVFATADGVVNFSHHTKKRFTGARREQVVVNITDK